MSELAEILSIVNRMAGNLDDFRKETEAVLDGLALENADFRDEVRAALEKYEGDVDRLRGELDGRLDEIRGRRVTEPKTEVPKAPVDAEAIVSAVVAKMAESREPGSAPIEPDKTFVVTHVMEPMWGLFRTIVEGAIDYSKTVPGGLAVLACVLAALSYLGWSVSGAGVNVSRQGAEAQEMVADDDDGDGGSSSDDDDEPDATAGR